MSLPMILVNGLPFVAEDDIKSEGSEHSSEQSSDFSECSNQSSSQTSDDSNQPSDCSGCSDQTICQKTESPFSSEEDRVELRKALFQRCLMTLRPAPFEHHWTVWHDKHSDSADYESRLSVLHEDVANIATFYQVYNNYPWDRIRMRDSVHVFLSGIKPIWEDSMNQNGGCWQFRVPRAKAQEFFHEVALLCLGGELQEAIDREHDHVLGVTTSVRFRSNLISVWNKLGSSERSINILKERILGGLSLELRPTDPRSYEYLRHSEKPGYREAIKAQKSVKN